MMFRRIWLKIRKQSGITMLELLIGMLITSLIATGVTTAVYQVVTGNARTSNHMIAVRQVQSAGYWVSRDSQMAQSVETSNATTTGFPLTLTWTEWDGERNVVTYDIGTGTGGIKQLDKEHLIYGTDGALTANVTSPVARYIIDTSSPPLTSCNLTDGVLTLTVTATVGSDSNQGTETRIYEIAPRPGL